MVARESGMANAAQLMTIGRLSTNPSLWERNWRRLHHDCQKKGQ